MSHAWTHSWRHTLLDMNLHPPGGPTHLHMAADRLTEQLVLHANSRSIRLPLSLLKRLKGLEEQLSWIAFVSNSPISTSAV